MATLIFCIVNSRPKQDRTFPIRLKVTNGTSVTYITTQYSVEKKQWNGGQVVRHPQAAMINAKLSQMLCDYQARLMNLPPTRPCLPPKSGSISKATNRNMMSAIYV